MGSDRRIHLRVTFAIKAAFYCRTGFLYNIPVVDIGIGGLRLDIPIDEQFLRCKDGTLKLFLRPKSLFNMQPYILEMPCQLVWFSDSGVGIEFINPGYEVVDSIEGMISTPPSHDLHSHFSPL
ncbi:MAG: PilZ domain-containing protein [Magnetococcales bacterium]|nr:PilZ domain-containing protein [Magnetococcales bacterium]